jgi:hypothetical protein
MFRQVGSAAVAGWAWNHRGTLVRGVDLLLRTPQRARTSQLGETPIEVRAIIALDESHPTSTAVRITGISDGAITLRDLPARDLEAAREVLRTVAEIVDVQTRSSDHPTLDEALAAAGG